MCSSDLLKIRGKAVIDIISYASSGLLFLAIAVGSWPNMLEAWDIGEAEGSGIITIPVYPIRTLVVVVSAVGVMIALLLIWQSLTNPEKYDESLVSRDEAEGAN